MSEIHGTTRDVIEDTTDIDGITFRFIDTAGIRSTDDKVEQLGIERTYQKMKEAKILIYLIDGSTDDDQQDKDMDEFMEIINDYDCPNIILGINKFDDITEYNEENINGFNAMTESLNSFNAFQSQCSGKPLKTLNIVPMSAKLGYNMDGLKECLVKIANVPEITENDVIITSARHYEALTKANESLQRVLESMDAGMSGDIIAEDLKMALEELGEITGGQISSQETLNNIFKHFCIGK